MQKTVAVLLFSISLFAMDPLVDARWLKKSISSKDLVIIDLSSKKAYENGHIPGALHSDISMWRKKHGKFSLVGSKERIETLMRSLGIGKDSRVVLYSHHTNDKDILKPAYVIWAMELYGFKNSAILDGGLKAWKREGGEVTTEIPEPVVSDFKAVFNPYMSIDIESVKERIGKVRMIDARPARFYFGAQRQPVLKRAGHISGATSYHWRYSFNDNTEMKSVEELRSMLVDGLGLDPEKEVVTYCTGGLETSMNYFVLHRLLRFSKARLYDASMKEWANRTDTPMTSYKWE